MIRVAGEKDIDELVAMETAAIVELGTDIPLREDWRERLKGSVRESVNKRIIHVLDEDGVLTGAIAVAVLDQPEYLVAYGVISELFVWPEYRNGHRALRLMSFARSILKQAGIRYAMTTVRHENLRRMYVRVGTPGMQFIHFDFGGS